ncbi:MAG TPA: hypothetical protein VGJ21_04315 [Terracidiphilus sp.]|jgi:hypothetical protein
MMWIAFAALQIVVIFAGIRQERRAGLWSWSKFAFALAFAGLEVAILLTPLAVMDLSSPRFVQVFCGAGVIAALNFIWMIIVARRWKLPDGRTSLQAYRDENPKK